METTPWRSLTEKEKKEVDGATVLDETSTQKPVAQVESRDERVKEDDKPGA